jgi:hypothetical protein
VTVRLNNLDIGMLQKDTSFGRILRPLFATPLALSDAIAFHRNFLCLFAIIGNQNTRTRSANLYLSAYRHG